MTDTTFVAISEAQVDWRDSTPVSSLHADPYFSVAGGIEETRHVFLAGNNLSNRLSALQPGETFNVCETGFGTGLNFLETWALFEQRSPDGSRLNFISTENRPLSMADLGRAHQAWPEHRQRCQQLQQQWPPTTPGYHTLWFDGGRVTLMLLYGDATQQLQQLDASVDAWFLDGFAPARNESLWQPSLYQQMARLSGAGTTVATYSAAGHVRRGLTAAGFSMQKKPGFGHKRDMSCGVYAGSTRPPPSARTQHVVVAGAGLAGVTVAAALAARQQKVTLLDPAGTARGDSGNLAGIVYSTPSAHITAQNRFYQSSYLHALRWMQRYGFPADASTGRLNGLVQLPGSARHRDKALAALAGDFWPASLMQAADGLPEGSYLLPQAGYISPRRWCQHLLDYHGITVIRDALVDYQEQPDGIIIGRRNSTQSLSADALVLATAHDTPQLAHLDTRLKSIRGQVSLVSATAESARLTQALCHSGYWTPAIDGLHCVGASFNLHETERATRAEDDQRNLAELRHNAPHLWQAMGAEQIAVSGARVGFRCQSNDFLPLAGALSQRVFCSIAHGSRGITGTPLCADLIAASICHDPPPMDRDMRQALAPGRFRNRRTRRPDP